MITSPTQLLANLAGSIAQMGGANVHDRQELCDAARSVMREAGIRPMTRIVAAKKLQGASAALAALQMLSDYIEEDDSDPSAQAMLELESARTAIARQVESLAAIVCQPLVRTRL